MELILPFYHPPSIHFAVPSHLHDSLEPVLVLVGKPLEELDQYDSMAWVHGAEMDKEPSVWCRQAAVLEKGEEGGQDIAYLVMMS